MEEDEDGNMMPPEEIDGVGADVRTLESVTSTDARAYKEHLQVVPTNASKLFGDLPPSETVKKALQQNLKTLSQNSQNSY